ncbi:MAG: hypothetical protein K2O32_04560 [Acetatifactor sp.]|nr:hypothetical protein [Acetatifactor sp.]
MNMIANIFLTILGMSLTAAYCILAVCLLRVLLRKMPKIFSYCLWSVVALRLVCPILPESRFSLMGDRVVESARQIASTNMKYELESGTRSMADGLEGDIVPNASGIHGLPETEGIGESGSGNVSAINDYPSGEVEGDSTTLANRNDTASINTTAGDNPQAGEIESGNIIYFVAAIWLGIFLLLCAYGIGSYLRLKLRLAKVAYTGRTFENIPVKYAPGIETPFVLGLVRPIVYLPDTLTDSEAMQCLSHERVHVQRRDYLVKQFAFVLACVHWFNPFVWLAFHLMSQDMEMSCDEQALQSPALADRKAYSDTLLKVSTSRVQFGGCPLAFGENSASLRIKNIMNYKKPGFWVVVVVCVAIVTCMVGLFTNPVNGTVDETEADIEAKVDKDHAATQGEPTDETQKNTLADIEQAKKEEALAISMENRPERSIGPVQAQYEAELVDIFKKNLENNYLKQIGTREASIRALEDVLMEDNEKLAKLQNNLNNSAGEEAKIIELETKIAELNKTAESLAVSIEEISAEKATLELRLQKMDITDMDGRPISLDHSADKYLNQPEINCFLMQNFNTSQIDLDFLFYDGAGLENSEPSAEERQLLEGTQEQSQGIWSSGIFYHFTGEQVDSFLKEKLGLPLSEIQYGTGSGNTLKDTWEYLEEYDSYTLLDPKGDTFYTKVECVYAFNYYNGILRLDYKKAGKTWSSEPLIEGSLYLAPKDAKNGDINHLNSYYIIGNVIHKGSLKDRDPENAFDLSEYLNRLKQS